MVGVAFFSAAQFLASLQWQNTAYKKNMVRFATHAHTHRAIYTGTHSPGCSRTAESRHSGKHRSYDPPSPSFYSSSSPSPLNSNTSCKQACSWNQAVTPSFPDSSSTIQKSEEWGINTFCVWNIKWMLKQQTAVLPLLFFSPWSSQWESQDNWYRDYKEQCDKVGEGNEEKYDVGRENSRCWKTKMQTACGVLRAITGMFMFRNKEQRLLAGWK